MSLFEQGQPSFGLNDAKIADWVGDGTYGTAVDVPSVQMLGVTLRFSSAELTGDDKITATAARPIGGSCRLRYGSISLAMLEVMLGGATTSSVASPNSVRNYRVDGGGTNPYFGIAGKALAESGDTHVFAPQVKITGDMPIAMLEYGAFAIPEVEATLVADETWGVLSITQYETATAVTIPPSNIPEIP